MGVNNDWLQARDSSFLAVMRSLSIFMIVLGHVGGFWFYPPWSEFLHVFVPVFFFISGAVSYNSYLKYQSISFYVKKRLIALFTPYYCICIFALVVYVAINSSFPAFSSGKLLNWITITPGNALMPFPLGQIWFLHALVIICLASPVLFWLYRQHIVFFILFLCCSIAAAAFQLYHNIAPSFVIAGQNLFRPLVHSLFFCLGFLVIDLPKLRSTYISAAVIGGCILFSIFLVNVLHFNPDYEFHTNAPDLYYVAGSLSAIWALILLQPYIMRLYEMLPLLQRTSDFFFRHTFSIYLLQSFAIFFVEQVLGLVHPQQKTITYAISKLGLVLLITLMMAPAFTKVSSWVAAQILAPRGRPKTI